MHLIELFVLYLLSLYTHLSKTNEAKQLKTSKA